MRRPVIRSSSFVCLSVLGGTLLMLSTTLTPLRGQSGASDSAARQVADTLDRMIQPRFLRFDLGFGVIDRLIRVQGHNAVRLRNDTVEEKRLLKQADTANRRYIVAFFHFVHVPAVAYRNAKGMNQKIPKTTGRGWEDRPQIRFVAGRAEERGRNGYMSVFQAHQAEWQSAALKAMPRLKQGQPVHAASGPWLLAMRPVRASQPACLNCHTSNRRDDTLGAMIYAVWRR